jgi:hypothetical protein
VAGGSKQPQRASDQAGRVSNGMVCLTDCRGHPYTYQPHSPMSQHSLLSPQASVPPPPPHEKATPAGGGSNAAAAAALLARGTWQPPSEPALVRPWLEAAYDQVRTVSLEAYLPSLFAAFHYTPLAASFTTTSTCTY